MAPKGPSVEGAEPDRKIRIEQREKPHVYGDNLAMNIAAAGPTFTEFTALDVITGLVNPGVAEPRGKHIVLRGVVVSTRIDGWDPRISGNALITINSQLLAADGSRPVWGEFQITADGGGVWVRTWTGQREPVVPGLWLAILKVVGHGQGGAVNGLEAKTEELVYSFDLVPQAFHGEVRGTILQPR